MALLDRQRLTNALRPAVHETVAQDFVQGLDEELEEAVEPFATNDQLRIAFLQVQNTIKDEAMALQRTMLLVGTAVVGILIGALAVAVSIIVAVLS